VVEDQGLSSKEVQGILASCLEHQAIGFDKAAGTVPCGRSSPLTTGHGVVRVQTDDGVYGWAHPDVVETINMGAKCTVVRSYFMCDPDASPGQSLAMLVESTPKQKVQILHIITPDEETNANVCDAHGWSQNALVRAAGWDFARKVCVVVVLMLFCSD